MTRFWVHRQFCDCGLIWYLGPISTNRCPFSSVKKGFSESGSAWTGDWKSHSRTSLSFALRLSQPTERELHVVLVRDSWNTISEYVVVVLY